MQKNVFEIQQEKEEMQRAVEEKPKVTSQEEAPARHLISAVLNAVSKQNGVRSIQTENPSSMVLIQQQQQQQQQQQATQLNNITGTAAPATSIAGLTGASSTATASEYSMYHHGMLDNADDHDGYDDSRDREELREQDRFLPIANVARIMKKAIPETGKIAKDAKECVQECVSEFISFITSEASERCQQEKRKTINGEDILFAMTTLGFDNYVEPLKVYLTKYRESLKGEKVLVSDYGQGVEGEENSNMQTLQYQVGNTLQPTMVSPDGTFAYTQAQVSQMQQSLHFNT